MGQLVKQIYLILPDRSNRIIASLWLAFIFFQVILFFFLNPKFAKEIALSLAMILSVVCSSLLTFRAKRAAGRQRLGWAVLGMYFIVVFFNTFKNLFGRVEIASAASLLSAGIVLLVAAFLLASDFIYKVSLKRSLIDAAWVGAVFFASIFYLFIRPFWVLGSFDRVEGVIFSAWSVFVVMAGSLIFITVYQSKKPSYGMLLVGGVILFTCFLGIGEIWIQGKGEVHSFLGGLDFLWHLSFSIFGVCSQVSISNGSQQIRRAKTSVISFITVVPLLVGIPVVFLSSPTEQMAIVSVAAILLILLAVRLLAVTEENRKLNDELVVLLHEDHLTGIPNRRGLEEYLDSLLKERSVALLFVDLDYFKEINDQFGHDAGDYVLRDIALKLKNSLRKTDYLARLGGDEFVIVISSDIEEKALDSLIKRIKESTKTSYEFSGKVANLDSTIGVCRAGKGADPKLLIKQADLTMIEGKKTSKGSVYFKEMEFQPSDVSPLEV